MSIPKPIRSHPIQSDIHDSLLEERLKIANVILPEDNLEDLVQLPIAPELVSRRLRAQRARQNSIPTSDPLSLPPHHSFHPHYDPRPSRTNLPTSLSHYAPISCPSSDDEHALHTLQPYSPASRPTSQHRPSHPPRPLGLPRPSGIPKPAKHSLPRPSLSSDPDRRPPKSAGPSSLLPPSSKPPPNTLEPQPLRQRTQSSSSRQLLSKPTTAPRARLKPARKHSLPIHTPTRPRSLSASSVIDAPLPPWSTDPSPRIYRLDPLASGAEPGFDDLILPTVARQLEKQQKLRTVDGEATAREDVSEWEAKGTPVLIRKVSSKHSPVEAQTVQQQVPTRSPSLVQDESRVENLTGGGHWSINSPAENHVTTRDTERDPRTPELSPSTSPEPPTGYERDRQLDLAQTTAQESHVSEIQLGQWAVHQQQQQVFLGNGGESGGRLNVSQAPFSGLGSAEDRREPDGIREVQRTARSSAGGGMVPNSDEEREKNRKNKVERAGNGNGVGNDDDDGKSERGCCCRCSVM